MRLSFITYHNNNMISDTDRAHTSWASKFTWTWADKQDVQNETNVMARACTVRSDNRYQSKLTNQPTAGGSKSSLNSSISSDHPNALASQQ